MAAMVDVYRAYQRLPRPVRAAADAVYRLVPVRMLYSRQTNAFLNDLLKSQRLPPDELRTLQFLRLKDLCIHAGEHTRYYRRVFGECGFDPRRMQAPEDIRVLPVLMREDIRERASELRSDAYGPGDVYDISTSGSTGTYLHFVQSKEYFNIEEAVTERYMRWMGMNKKAKRAVFYRAIMNDPVAAEGLPPFQRFRNRLVLSQFHTGDASMAHYVRLLNDFRPDYILGSPSTGIALTRYCARTGEARFRPSSLMCYAENLRGEHRREMEEFWGCRVFNRYGHSEGCVSAGDCGEGRMHLAAEYGYAEFLGPDGSPAAPGEEARIVATGMFTHAMPFIRYDTGDRGAHSDEPCLCGRTLPVLASVDGRGDDVVYGRAGQQVSALRSIFVRTEGIKHTQIVQEKPGEIIVRIVPDTDYDPAVKDVILENLRRDAGDAFDVRFEIVEELERSPSGKIRLIRNKTPQG